MRYTSNIHTVHVCQSLSGNSAAITERIYRTFVRLCLVAILCTVPILADENVGIGTNAPDTSAVLDISIQSLTRPKGVLFPRMTQVQRDAILLPAKGLLIFNTTANRIEMNVGTTTAPVWAAFLNSGQPSGGDWSLTGNSGINPTTNYLGTTDAQSLVFKTNAIERMRILANGRIGVGTTNPLALFSVGSQSQFQVDSLGRITAPEINLAAAVAFLKINGNAGLNGDLLMSGGANTSPRWTKTVDSLLITNLTSTNITTNRIRANIYEGDSINVRGGNITNLNSTNLNVTNNATIGVNLTVNNTVNARTVITDTLKARFIQGGVPFDSLKTGVNSGQNLQVGNGSTLSPTGTGTITANKFIGAGSTSDSVDLATAEVGGVLPPSKGGTGVNSSTARNGQIPIGNGSGFTLDTLRPGTGISITNAPGSITVSSTSAQVGNGTQNNTTLRYDSAAGRWVENVNLRADANGNITTSGTAIVGGVTTTGGVTLNGPQAPLRAGGNGGNAGNVLVSQGATNTPVWTDSIPNLKVGMLNTTNINNSGTITTSRLNVTDSANINKLGGNTATFTTTNTNTLNSTNINNSNNISTRTINVTDSLRAANVNITNNLTVQGNTTLNTFKAVKGEIDTLKVNSQMSADTLFVNKLGGNTLNFTDGRITNITNTTLRSDSISSRTINNSGIIRTDSLSGRAGNITTMNSTTTNSTTLNSTTINNSGTITSDSLRTRAISNTQNISTATMNATDSVLTNKLRATGDANLNDVWADSIASRQIRNSQTIWTDSLFANKFKVNGNIDVDSINARTVTVQQTLRADSLSSRAGNITTMNSTTTNSTTLNSTTINNSGTITGDSLRTRAISNTQNISTATLTATDSILTNKLRATGDANLNDVWADSIASRQIRNSQTIWTDSLFANKFKVNGNIDVDSINARTVRVAETLRADSLSGRAGNITNISSTTINNSGTITGDSLAARTLRLSTLTNNRILVSINSTITEAPALTNGQLLIGSTGAAPQAATLTAGNNISIANTAGAITISTTMPALDSGNADNQTVRWDNTLQRWVRNNTVLATNTGTLTLGGTTQSGSLVVNDGASNTSTIVSAAQGANRSYTIPNAGANASFVMTEGTQTVNGVKTYGNNANFNATVGIGTVAGTNALTLNGTDPLKMTGVQNTNTTDTVLVIDPNGIVQRRAAASLAGSTAWSLTGNTGLVDGTTNLLGTQTNIPIRIITNNTEAMRVLDNQRVAIGPTPSSANFGRLEVRDNSTADQFAGLAVISNGVVSGVNTVSYAAQFSKQSASTTNIAGNFVATGGTNNFAITAQGDVFLGAVDTLTPASLRNTILPSGNPRRTYMHHATITGELSVGNNGPGTTGQVLISQGPNNGATWINQSTLIGNNAWMLDGNTVTSERTFGTQSNHALPILTNNVERMRITASGNIGIGTNAPTQLVEINNGNLLISNSNNTSSQLQIAAARANGLAPLYTTNFQAGTQTASITYTLPTTAPTVSGQVLTATTAGVMSWASPNSTSWDLSGNAPSTSWNGTTGSFLGTTNAQPLSIATTNATAQDIRFYTGASGANERMRIDANGNVGVGTTGAPNTTLDVNGAVAIRPGTSTVTTDNQAVTVGNRSFVRITSDGTPANRTITLSNGLQDGQIIILRVSGGGTATNGIEIADSGNCNLSGLAQLLDGAVIQLLWDGAANTWFEVTRSHN
ncbi:MAG: hypothetical protein JNL32_03790 [Candidatus Kapabacteria bacterium]|nr:hypothetical protein [Candidatus Kapabacteria bacterium]